MRELQVITGSVQSLFLSKLPAKSLPHDSLYLPCRDTVEATMSGAAAGDGSLSTETYAELVVANALKREPTKRQWAGKLTTEIWAANTFLWDTAWVSSSFSVIVNRANCNRLGLASCWTIWH